ncbi:hypothetical protein SAMN05421827_1142 [Pedobacter terrae]|uniref:Uncharacterized protein n=1 Tax=Pedobacter terrae TaxID=405671 RepID=A0A1G7YL03_9SPHI|nr:hypothetical protein [Pedobacter terrae]SDG97074.1 hypothetical protein SAMN05421827_1142 [Pedobacter terrae]
MSTDLVKTYILNRSSEDIKLSLIIGGIEQTGTSLITLNEELILKDYQGDLHQKIIGQNDNLHQKVLNIITVITDTSPNHNHTDLYVLLEGGFVTKGYKMEEEVQPGASTVYTAEITFYQF